MSESAAGRLGPSRLPGGDLRREDYGRQGSKAGPYRGTRARRHSSGRSCGGSGFLLEGTPGTGKTTIALRFLVEGAKADERGLYVTLSETAQELRIAAESHGWTLDDKVEVFEVVPPESLLDSDQQQSLLYSSDLELGETTKLIFEAVERSKATRIVLDSLSEIRLLAQSSLRYRRQILAL